MIWKKEQRDSFYHASETKPIKHESFKNNIILLAADSEINTIVWEEQRIKNNKCTNIMKKNWNQKQSQKERNRINPSL